VRARPTTLKRHCERLGNREPRRTPAAQRHREPVHDAVLRERDEHEHVLRTVLLELGVLARVGPDNRVLARRALGDVDGVVRAHGRHRDERAGVLPDVRAKVDELALPLVEVRAGAGLVRDEREVKGLAVVGDDAVGVVEPGADLVQEVGVALPGVARAEEVEDVLRLDGGAPALCVCRGVCARQKSGKGCQGLIQHDDSKRKQVSTTRDACLHVRGGDDGDFVVGGAQACCCRK